MAQIFISWSSPDASVVNEVAARLVQEGLSVDEYSKDATCGDINRNVSRYVNEAWIALVFLSAKTVEAKWIHDEVAFCVHRRSTGEFPEMIPVLIGDVPKEKIPHQLQLIPLKKQIPLSDPPSEEDIQTVIDSVNATLGGEARRIIPAALLAMTNDEANAWLNRKDPQKLLDPLLNAVGMQWNDQTKKMLLERYGKTAEDFAPFPGIPIKNIVQQSLEKANKERLEQRKPKLSLWWCTDELINPGNSGFQRAGRLWEDGSSIVIVDSISVLDPGGSVYKKFEKLPTPQDARASALLWVPPYTLHTTALEQITEAALKKLVLLLRRYDRYVKDYNRPYVAFDIGTRPTLRRWLHEAFCSVDTKPHPNLNAIESMQGEPGGDKNLREVFSIG